MGREGIYLGPNVTQIDKTTMTINQLSPPEYVVFSLKPQNYCFIDNKQLISPSSVT